MKNKHKWYEHLKPTSFPIDIVVKTCFGADLPYKVTELKPRTAYVVNIKLYKSNVVHKTIMFTGFEASNWVDHERIGLGYPDSVILFCDGYETPRHTTLFDIYWFEVVSEIPDYNIDIPKLF